MSQKKLKAFRLKEKDKGVLEAEEQFRRAKANLERIRRESGGFGGGNRNPTNNPQNNNQGNNNFNPN